MIGRNSTKPFIAKFKRELMDFFPFDTVRPEQNKLLADIKEAVETKKNIIAHAPTGLGKTSAALGFDPCGGYIGGVCSGTWYAYGDSFWEESKASCG